LDCALTNNCQESLIVHGKKCGRAKKNMKKPWCPIESYRCSRIPPGKFSHNPPRTAAQRRRPGASVKARRSNTAPSGAVRVIRRLQLLVWWRKK
jgi:hypothetical protein